MEALRNVTEWSILSILLGVKESTLQYIYKDNEGHACQAEQAIVKAWLEDTDEPSWAMLVTALQDNLVGMNGIGKKIKKQHSSECMMRIELTLSMQLVISIIASKLCHAATQHVRM